MTPAALTNCLSFAIDLRMNWRGPGLLLILAPLLPVVTARLASAAAIGPCRRAERARSSRGSSGTISTARAQPAGQRPDAR